MKTTESHLSALPEIRRNSGVQHLIQSSRFATRLGKLLLVTLVLVVIAMALLPWYQTSRSSGQVVSYTPQERQQSIEAAFKGVVSRIEEGMVEGARVKKGDFILEIQPFAANLRQQLESQLRELKNKLDSEVTKAEIYAKNIVDFTEAREFTISGARQLVESAVAKRDSKKRLVAAYEAKELQARLNYERQKGLEEAGAAPVKEVEKLRKDWDVAQSELQALNEDIKSLEREVSAKENELEEKKLIAQTKIDYARAMEQDALGKSATIRKEIADLEIKLTETTRGPVYAPRDGIVFRLPVVQGQTVKEGDPLLTIVPETDQIAVELFVNGNDISLVRPGDKVRLQFEGWPAVQVAGWPSVSVGVFEGLVSVVDAADNGKGQFRILVTPDNDITPWPSSQFLRQGVRVNGWVIMKRVSLGYEIWRQLNGFPVIRETGDGKDDKQAKPPKIPK